MTVEGVGGKLKDKTNEVSGGELECGGFDVLTVVCLYCDDVSMQSVGEVLLPRMAQLSTHIQSLLDSSLPSGQQNTLRVYSVLLVSM